MILKETKKLMLVLVMFLIILGTVGIVVVKESQKAKAIYDEFKNSFMNEENTLIYIGSSSCSYCSLLNPSLKDMKQRYDFDYVYIDVSTLSEIYYNQIMVDLGLTKLGTPYLAIVSNGKIVDTQNGYADYDVTFEFLKENEIIDESAELLLNYIGMDEYNKLLKSKENEIIVVGQSKCGYCVQTKVILNDIVDEYGTEINYLNITYLDTDETTEFKNSLEYFQSSSWGTPVTLIVKNGKIVDMLTEMVSESEFIEFFEENGVL